MTAWLICLKCDKRISLDEDKENGTLKHSYQVDGVEFVVAIPFRIVRHKSGALSIHLEEAINFNQEAKP